MFLKVLVLAITFILTSSYTIYKILNESSNIKKDKIIQSTKYIEKQIEKKLGDMIKIEKRTLIKKYNDIINESILSRLYINIFLFTVLSGIAGIITYKEMSIILNQHVGAIVISCMIFLLPFNLLEIEVVIQRKKVRKHMPHFLLMFLQTFLITGDAIQTLYTIKNNIKEPLRGYIKEFLKNYSLGMELKLAIEKLKSRSDNEVFKNFCDTIYSQMEYGITINQSIESSIERAYSHQMRYMERITENSGNIFSILFILGIFITAIQRLVNTGDYLYILKNSIEGKIVVNVILIIFIVVLFLLKKSVSYEDR